MNNIKIALLISSVTLLFTACGGGGDSSVPTVDAMSAKDGVAIIYHYPAEVCESDLLLNELQTSIPEAYNWLVSVESNNVNCATYGKVEGVDCMTENYALTDPTAIQYDTSCVVGFDLNTLSGKLSKVVGDTPQWSEDISLAAEFAMDAQ